MKILCRRAYARAGLIGNPSDGYNGKTISIIVRNFWAEAVLYEWDQVEVVLSDDVVRSRYRNIRDLHADVAQHGYYGGIRLIKATIKKFVEYCDRQGHRLHDRNFAIRYSSNIPRQVGLAGSSAIIVATLRCLMDYYQVDIDLRAQPSLVLSVETEELGIGAGLQDRVIQIYEGAVWMDFSEAVTEEVDGYRCGRYERIDPRLLPPLYLAYRSDLSEPTEVFHNDLKARYDRGEAEVVDAMQRFAGLAQQVKDSIAASDFDKMGQAIDDNFDLRRSICQLATGHIEMVETARGTGATAKYSGSGGAIIGTYADDQMFQRLTDAMAAIGCQVVKPKITA